MEATLFKLTLWTFFASMIAHFLSIVPAEGKRSGKILCIIGIALAVIGFASLTTSLVTRWSAQGRVPISSSYEYLMVLAWCVSVIYLILMFKMKNAIIGACMAPGLFLAIVFAGLYPQKLEMTLVPALQSYWMNIHVSMTIVGEAAFAVAFTAGILYLIKNVDWPGVPAVVKRRSLWLGVAALAVGMAVVLVLKAMGLVLAELNSVQLLMALIGGGAMVALPIYVFAWRRFCAAGTEATGNFGGLLFAVVVLALLISGMGLGSYQGRSSDKLDLLTGEIHATDEMASLVRGPQAQLELPAWQAYLDKKAAKQAKLTDLEAMQAERKHSLSRSEAESVLGAGPLLEEFTFPLSLGEIRAQLQEVASEVQNLESIAGQIGIPFTLHALSTLRTRLVNDYNAVFATSLVPMHEGKEPVFMGYMVLFGVPVFMLLYLLAGPVQSRVPEIDTLDSLAYRSVSLGFPIFTFGALLAGAIWAHYAWGKWWSNDPKEMGSLIVWLVYLIYLHARFVRRWSGNQAAVAAILGFLFAVLSFVGNSVLGGLHAYG